MLNTDLSVLWFFNQTIAAKWLDPIMIGFSTVNWWIPVYVIAAVWLIWKYKWRGVRVVLGAVIVVTCSDQLGNLVIKPLFERLRPCAVVSGKMVVPWIRLPSGPRLGFSFPSSHAMNNFAVAIYFTTLFPKAKRIRYIYILALLISISRMYLGLHYPTDVVGGALIGMALGFTLAAVSEFIEERIRRRGLPSISQETARKEREMATIDPSLAPWNRLPQEVEKTTSKK